MKNTSTPIGTLRIGSKDLQVYEKTSTGWKKSNRTFPQAMHVIQLFKVNHMIKALIDQKNKEFLRGQYSPKGKIQGARITVLPNGEQVDKPYSLFAKELTIHDETSHGHWDVIYQNPGGTFAYSYALSKRNASIQSKYKKVESFDRHYALLHKAVTRALSDKNDFFALPMYTLLKTYMRVGNEVYFKANHHKGLTTLAKKDISIKGNEVTFDYISKGGVPVTLKENFPELYITRLKNNLQKLKSTDFVFTSPEGKPLKDTHFMKAFENYCGEKFYPHIVRSHYATRQARSFLSSHRKATKEEVKELFISIAEKLGHKRFVKKDNEWKDSYTVTVHHYLEPSIVNKINKMVA